AGAGNRRAAEASAPTGARLATGSPSASGAQAAGAQGAGAGAQPARIPGATAGTTTSASNMSAFSAADEQRLREMRQTFDTRMAALEARGAGVWGGREFAMAKTRSAESVGAHDAGNPRVAQERLATAMKLLDTVESKAPQALSAQVAAGEKALGAGQ